MYHSQNKKNIKRYLSKVGIGALVTLALGGGYIYWESFDTTSEPNEAQANTTSGDHNVSGWLWAANSEYQIGNETDSSIGWISLDSSNPELTNPDDGDYGIRMKVPQNGNGTTSAGNKSGINDYITEMQAVSDSGINASFGWNGGESDGPRLGWLNFAPGNTPASAPSTDKSRLTFTNPDPNSRNRSVGDTSSSGGYLEGWARFCSVFVNNCSGNLVDNVLRGGFDGWVKFNGSQYGPIRKYNRFSGFAWGDSVVGWLNFGNDDKKYNAEVDLTSEGDGIDGGPNALVQSSSEGNFTDADQFWTEGSRYYGFHLDFPGARFPAINKFDATPDPADEGGTQLRWNLLDLTSNDIAYYETVNEWAGVKWDGSQFVKSPGESMNVGEKIPANRIFMGVQPAIGPNSGPFDTATCDYNGSTKVRTCTYKLRAVNRMGDEGNTVSTEVDIEFGGSPPDDPDDPNDRMEATVFPVSVDRSTEARIRATVFFNANEEVLDGESGEIQTWSVTGVGGAVEKKFVASDDSDASPDNDYEDPNNPDVSSASGSYDNKLTREWDLNFEQAPVQKFNRLGVSVRIRTPDGTEEVEEGLDTVTNFGSRNVQEIAP